MMRDVSRARDGIVMRLSPADQLLDRKVTRIFENHFIDPTINYNGPGKSRLKVINLRSSLETWIENSQVRSSG